MHQHSQTPLKQTNKQKLPFSKVATGTIQIPSWAQWHACVISEFRRERRLLELEASLGYKNKDPYVDFLTFCSIAFLIRLAICLSSVLLHMF